MTIRKVITLWLNWRARRRLHAAYPELAEISKRREAYRKAHKRGVKACERQARDLMSDVLRGAR